MRLINTRTLELKEFFGKDIPVYAILSHVWGAEEVTYQEWTSRQSSVVSNKSGYQKIIGACDRAVRDRLDWLWVDTNCIDKTSSAELSEAINSMFKWYADSKVCYAYLNDVTKHAGDWNYDFRKSRWFTRGWTLQELLAPKLLTFFSKEWRRLGDRSDAKLLSIISDRTSIEMPYLTGHSQLNMASVAKKMSWLSRRETTREEDIAYCMLGIFEVNMPLLYGEGLRAFLRLQEEIIKISHDHTLFCWSFDESVPSNWVSILAPTPHVFRKSAEYVRKDLSDPLTVYSMTNLGLSIQLPIITTFTHALVLVLLNAGLAQHDMSTRACLPMAYERSQTTATRDIPLLVRHRFPRNPVNLYRFMAAKMRRHQIFVKTRPGLVAAHPAAQPSVKAYGVLILMETTNTRLFEGSKAIGFMSPINSGDEAHFIETPDIDTYPAGKFDFQQSVLHLSPIGQGEHDTFACLLEIRHLREPQSGYFIFFGLREGSGGKQSWVCQIVTRKSLAFLKRSESGWDLEMIFDNFISQTLYKSRGEQRRASLPDESLIVRMGPHLKEHNFKSLRVVWLLGKKQEFRTYKKLDDDVSDTGSTAGNTGV
ncbi:heterokaryon incompatibility protein-domain-containing protein [Xylariaceae sp. FL1272]|nr:heterokaryon incompatibility protein-domain-containing protein [Xylariaceae sp. FL1272]